MGKKFKNKYIVAILSTAFFVVPMILALPASFFENSLAVKVYTSLPFQVFRIIYLIVFCAGLGLYFKRILKPSLFLIHLGLVLSLIGVIHDISTESYKVGFMQIYEGEYSNMLYYEETDSHGHISYAAAEKPLNFAVGLDDFEYIPYDVLKTVDPAGHENFISSVPGAVSEIKLYGSKFDKAVVEIINNFSDLKYEKNNEDKMVPVPGDRIGASANPATLLSVNFFLKDVKQDSFTFPLFHNQPDPFNADDPLRIYAVGMAKAYISRVKVLENREIVKRAEILVNKPMFYNGYFFYQNSYDSKNLEYTVLGVRRAGGMWLIFAGYGFIIAGMLVLLMRPAFFKLRNSRKESSK